VFKIKICGVRTSADAQLAADAGADAIGLNFYESSPRYVAVDQAAAIVSGLPSNVQRVGVFVNADAKRVAQVADAVPLDIVQLHGDEPPGSLGQYATRPLLRAVRCRGGNLEPVIQYLARCQTLGVLPAAILLDAYQAGLYGGSGSRLNWDLLTNVTGRLGNVYLVLAGGLSPGNVAEAIQTVRPNAVDVASGVELRPGEKDAALIHAFVDQARRALERNTQDTQSP
jgi:phosphoribosylanthranilate isomerase